MDKLIPCDLGTEVLSNFYLLDFKRVSKEYGIATGGMREEFGLVVTELQSTHGCLQLNTVKELL
mgnify:CR=1 FL=1